MQSNLGIGQNLQAQYAANPLSDYQKQAYGNSAGLANQFRQNMPGIFANMSQQGYTRQNPVASFNPYTFTAPQSQASSNLGFSVNPVQAQQMSELQAQLAALRAQQAQQAQSYRSTGDGGGGSSLTFGNPNNWSDSQSRAAISANGDNSNASMNAIRSSMGSGD
jgi:hypothetical protein